MIYKCCFRGGIFVDALAESEEPTAATQRDYEIVDSGDLVSQESDWLVSVGTYEVPAHKIDTRLVEDSETYLDG